jgi:hypothetical protein
MGELRMKQATARYMSYPTASFKRYGTWRRFVPNKKTPEFVARGSEMRTFDEGKEVR